MKLTLKKLPNPDIADPRILDDCFKDAEALSKVITALCKINTPDFFLEIGNYVIALAVETRSDPPQAWTKKLHALQMYFKACHESAKNPGQESEINLTQAGSQFEAETLRSINIALREIGSSASRRVTFSTSEDEFDLEFPHQSVIPTETVTGEDDQNEVEIKAIYVRAEIRTTAGTTIILDPMGTRISAGDQIEVGPDTRRQTYKQIIETNKDE